MVETLRKSAPHARLTLHALGPEYDYERALAEGGLDIVIGNWPDPPGQLHLSPLLDDELVCVMAEANPLARKAMTVAQYLAAPHVVPMPYSPSHRGVVDTHLAAMRVARNVRVVLPFFSMAPHLAAGHRSPVHDDAAFRGALREVPAARHRGRRRWRFRGCASISYGTTARTIPPDIAGFAASSPRPASGCGSARASALSRRARLTG